MECFIYDPSSPTFLTWKVNRYGGKHRTSLAASAGTQAGSINKNKGRDYATVRHGRTNWFAHRIIWIIHYGELDSECVIDHIDGNSLNNDISNLRVVKQILNNRNTSKRKDNNTGISGVHFTTAKGSGKNSIHTYATASWYSEPNKRKCKHFAVSKFGLLEAFHLATEFREQKIKELNSQGFGYTNLHGTTKEN